MRKDLQALLDDVWEKSANGTRSLTFGEIYAGYEAPSDDVEFVEGVHPDDVGVGFTEAESVRTHDRIPTREILGTTASGQKIHGSSISNFEDDPLFVGGQNTAQGYLWFGSPYYVANAAIERVVIHANPYNRLIRLMKLIRREMLQMNPIFAGVNSAKVATLPCFNSGRNDTIIIYTTTQAATQAVLHRLRRWIAGGDVSSRDFLDALPYLIKSEAPGIGWGSEPPAGVQVLASYPAKLSFGKYLSQVLQIGLEIFADRDNNARSRKTYQDVLADVLVKAGFDLDNPHKISPPTPVFLESVPWPKGNEWKKKRLYLTMVKDHGFRPFRST